MLHSGIMIRPFDYLNTYAKTGCCSPVFSPFGNRLAITSSGCLRTFLLQLEILLSLIYTLVDMKELGVHL